MLERQKSRERLQRNNISLLGSLLRTFTIMQLKSSHNLSILQLQFAASLHNVL